MEYNLTNRQKYLVSSVLLFLIFYAFLGSSQNLTFNGIIDNDTNWDYDTIKVDGDITINEAVTLTIDKGTVIEFQGDYEMAVFGNLQAIGTRTDSIRFTYYDKTGYFNDRLYNGWKGISYNTSSEEDTSRFDYCIFEYATNGVFRTYNSSISVLNSLFHYNTNSNGGAIFAIETNLIIKECTFYDNYGYLTGGAILAQQSTIDIERSLFLKNTSQHGGAIQTASAVGRIFGCIFSHNTANFGGALDLGGRLRDDEDYGTSMIANCIIINNQARLGGAINGTGGFYLLINNTICNNIADEGKAVRLSDYYILINNIFWDDDMNGSELLRLNTYEKQVAAINNYVKDGEVIDTTGYYIFQDNIFDGVEFKNPNNQFIIEKEKIVSNWSLKSNSSCIDAGSNDMLNKHEVSIDITEKDRIINEIVDMGAVEFDNELILSLDDLLFKNAPLVYPNPVINILNISFPEKNHNSTVTIYRVSGEEIFFKDSINTESISITLNEPQGIFFVKISNKRGIILKKIITEGT